MFDVFDSKASVLLDLSSSELRLSAGLDVRRDGMGWGSNSDELLR